MAGSKSPRRMRYIKSVREIPRLETERAEAEFWAAHSLAEIWDQLEPVRIDVSPRARRLFLGRTRKMPITLRLEEQQIQRAKQVAHAKSQSYQALVRSWISQALDREERAVRAHRDAGSGIQLIALCCVLAPMRRPRGADRSGHRHARSRPEGHPFPGGKNGLGLSWQDD